MRYGKKEEVQGELVKVAGRVLDEVLTTVEDRVSGKTFAEYFAVIIRHHGKQKTASNGCDGRGRESGASQGKTGWRAAMGRHDGQDESAMSFCNDG